MIGILNMVALATVQCCSLISFGIVKALLITSIVWLLMPYAKQ